MANKSVARMGLDSSLLHRLVARKVITAKDALGLTELELMELLDFPMEKLKIIVSRITESVCPPHTTVLAILNERTRNEVAMGHLSTQLDLLDNALCGGIPFGVVTELVGPAGIGKTQLCFMLSIQASIPANFGGLGSGVVYFDTERKFSATRLVEIGRSKYPACFDEEEKIRQIAERILIFTPASAKELVDSLQNLQATIIEHRVKLLIIDSMATLLKSDNDSEMRERQELLGQQASLLKYLAESFRMPVVVTNHVTTSSIFEGPLENAQAGGSEAELLAALGTRWAHAVNIRLVLELREGRRCIRVAKCPLSAAIAIPYVVTSSGISVDGDEALDVNEQDVMAVYQNYVGDYADEEIGFNAMY